MPNGHLPRWHIGRMAVRPIDQHTSVRMLGGRLGNRPPSKHIWAWPVGAIGHMTQWVIGPKAPLGKVPSRRMSIGHLGRRPYWSNGHGPYVRSGRRPIRHMGKLPIRHIGAPPNCPISTISRWPNLPIKARILIANGPTSRHAPFARARRAWPPHVRQFGQIQQPTQPPTLPKPRTRSRDVAQRAYKNK